MNTRRRFIALCGAIAGATSFSYLSARIPEGIPKGTMNEGNGKMKLHFTPYELHLNHVFTIATFSRSTTPVILTEITYDNIVGYGEASMPPYLSESYSTASSFLLKIDLEQFSSPFLVEDILSYVDSIAPGNYAAKASVDIALHDLIGKLLDLPLYRMWGLNPSRTPDTSFTIGIDTPEVVRNKVVEASPYNILKVKLGKGNDREMIQSVRAVTDKPLCVDVNQGWKDRNAALDMIHWLKDQGVVFVEQPLEKTAIEDIAWLTEKSPLPVLADEALQTVSDLKKVSGLYNGINVKLMKCGGLRAAYTLIKAARAFGMKVLIGCMTETSCAVTAAAHLSPLADWADLDGNLLISNDIFNGIKITNGKIILPEAPGIGVVMN
jgi:L-alanine-DL-glutamate epimerase-like enolase superfamily enzyme